MEHATSYQPRNTPIFQTANKTFFQPKLSINQANDSYEQEANAMAEKVVRPDGKENSFFKPATNPIQRKCEACEEGEMLQRKESSGQINGASSEVSSYVNSLASKGSSLPDGSRHFFESRFGHDFSGVKIHNDTAAAMSAQSINALAYTTGNHIVFNQSQFAPETKQGKQLLAHELTHVVQQNSDSVHRDSIQRLTVDPAASPPDGLCGKFERRFTFRLDNKAPTDGYFVQRIDRYDNEMNCPDLGRSPAHPTAKPFWEAFFTKKDYKTFYRQGIGFTDSSSHDSKPNKAGARYAYGEIRFFPIAITGNLGRNRVAGSWQLGQDQHGSPAEPSGDLPSTDKEPSWWNSHTEGPAKRFVTADWRCCPNGNNYNVIKASV